MKAKTANILKNLNAAGQFSNVAWSRNLKTRKDFPGIVTKITAAVVTSGTDYANRKSVKEAIANGERGEVESLPWGVWLDFPRVIVHTPKGATLQSEYIRLYPPSEAQVASFTGLAPKTEYFINGKLATAKECEPLCLASEFRHDDKPIDCLTVNAENIIAVNGVAV